MIYTRGLDLSGSLESAGGLLGGSGKVCGWFTLYYYSDGNGNITSLISYQEAIEPLKQDTHRLWQRSG